MLRTFGLVTPIVLSVSLLMAAPARAQNNLVPGKDWKIGISITFNEENGRRTGVKILKIILNSPAESSGLKAGDVVHAIDGKLFDDPKALRDDVMGSDRKEIVMVYQRDQEFLQQRMALKTIEVEEGIFTDLPGGPVKKKVNVKQLVPIGRAQKTTDPRINRTLPPGTRLVPDPRKR